MAEEDARSAGTVQSASSAMSRPSRVVQRIIRLGVDMEIDQSKCGCARSFAGKSGAFRVALCVCSIVTHLIVGSVGLNECAVDENIPRFVLARSSFYLLDIGYVIGYALMRDPNRRLFFLPELRYTGAFALAIAGAVCIYPTLFDVQHDDATLQTYCSIVCYWFAFGAVSGDLLFYSLLILVYCSALIASLRFSCRSRDPEPDVDP